MKERGKKILKKYCWDMAKLYVEIMHGYVIKYFCASLS